jgi:hypothetical protein
MNALWTAQVHLLTPPNEVGDTRCYTNVVAWGRTAAEFGANVTTILGRRAWTVLSIVQCRRSEQCILPSDEMTAQIEEAGRIEGSCIFGTLHYYPSKAS